jgi:hypothetical protein
MKTTVRQSGDGGQWEWEVWIDLDDEPAPMRNMTGFCIGVGATREAAVTDALVELEAAMVALKEGR